jgi:cell division septation protein DedD
MSLEQDYTTVPGQLYACLSVVGPEAPQKNDKFGIKIRGAFASRDEAANHAKRLQKEDSTFDIYVVDMYKWLLIPPDPLKIEDVHYTNEKLEEIMTGYRENQAEATRMFNDRKRDMMESKSYLKAGDENSRFYSKPDEPPISHPADVIERLRKEKPDTPMEDLVKEADEIVATEIEDRRKKREAEASTNGTIEESPEEEGEPEVSSA